MLLFQLILEGCSVVVLEECCRRSIIVLESLELSLHSSACSESPADEEVGPIAAMAAECAGSGMSGRSGMGVEVVGDEGMEEEVVEGSGSLKEASVSEPDGGVPGATLPFSS